MERRNERIKDEIIKFASQFVGSESNRNSLITVTNAYLTNDIKKAIIFFTVLPDTQEEQVLNFLKRKRGEFRVYIRKNSRIGQLPFFDFEIDKGEKSRQRLEDLIT